MVIKVPEVRTCCLYFSLKTGVKIFGFISLVGCILLVVLSFLEIFGVAMHAQEYFTETVAELSADIVVQGIQITASVLLLLGVYQKKARFVLPWLFTTVLIVLWEIVIQPSLVGRMIGIHLDRLSVTWFLITIVMLIDDIYGLLVVYSYYLSVTPQTTNPVQLTQT